jgi:hypothetical protein
MVTAPARVFAIAALALSAGGRLPGQQIKTPRSDWLSIRLDGAFRSEGVAVADIDRDGLLDIVTGKRWYAHGPVGDPGSQQDAVVAWFALRRTAAGVAFDGSWIHHDSGVGTQFVVTDMNGDGRPDVVTSNKKGVHVHLLLRP